MHKINPKVLCPNFGVHFNTDDGLYFIIFREYGILFNYDNKYIYLFYGFSGAFSIDISSS